MLSESKKKGLNELKTIQECLEDSSRIEKQENANQFRSLFYEFFVSENFKKTYLKFFEKLKKQFNWSQDSIIQKFPTPRIVMPNRLATSFHNDNWYGHGLQSYTCWVSLNGVEAGSGVNFVNSVEDNDFLLKKFRKDTSILSKVEKLRGLVDPHCSEFLARKGDARVFHSTAIHGSPMNSSNFTRVSIDFRVCIDRNTLGSKNAHDYYQVISGLFKPIDVIPTEINYLKYINGEHGFSTQSQHLLISSFAKENGLSIVSQEAEIEGHNCPMLKHYLTEKSSNKAEIEGIIVSTERMLSSEILKLCKNKLNVKTLVCAFEKKAYVADDG